MGPNHDSDLRDFSPSPTQSSQKLLTQINVQGPQPIPNECVGLCICVGFACAILLNHWVSKTVYPYKRREVLEASCRQWRGTPLWREWRRRRRACLSVLYPSPPTGAANLFFHTFILRTRSPVANNLNLSNRWCLFLQPNSPKNKHLAQFQQKTVHYQGS